MECPTHTYHDRADSFEPGNVVNPDLAGEYHLDASEGSHRVTGRDVCLAGVASNTDVGHFERVATM